MSSDDFCKKVGVGFSQGALVSPGLSRCLARDGGKVPVGTRTWAKTDLDEQDRWKTRNGGEASIVSMMTLFCLYSPLNLYADGAGVTPGVSGFEPPRGFSAYGTRARPNVMTATNPHFMDASSHLLRDGRHSSHWNINPKLMSQLCK